MSTVQDGFAPDDVTEILKFVSVTSQHPNGEQLIAIAGGRKKGTGKLTGSEN